MNLLPDLTEMKNHERWKKLELAKRRCICTFLKLWPPLESPARGGHPPLHFQFLAGTESSPVKTGHQDGMITVNIAEAGDDVRSLSICDSFRSHRKTAVYSSGGKILSPRI